MKYAVVNEETSDSVSAYVPDLPGCVGTGATRKEVERNIRDGIALHVKGLRREREPVPEPSALMEVVEAAL